MKTIKILGLLAFATSMTVAANNAIVFPGPSNTAVENAPVVFPVDKTPVPLVGGYQIENGILTSSTYNCGINISDLDIEAKLKWDGATPQLLIVGTYKGIMCRSGVTGPISVDLSKFIQRTPTYILDRLVVANHAPLNL
ncbi:hypothetical protein [Psychromonas sp. Urea-02u-13]|uniref:hypothetical protein n=1 Tax=Psychromonas sp. Urea-02u-13 TaxID=2058326 RepID=UPI000C31E5FB|nr:hypothetical protein [Psychromonas sp. Urea-02u-13]PKG38913.1 hypothetical protein CXF74_11185 [Psychromonas sp. Urea-02u-13]